MLRDSRSLWAAMTRAWVAVLLTGIVGPASARTPGEHRPGPREEIICAMDNSVALGSELTHDGCFAISDTAVVRRGTDGQALWSRTLEGDLGGVRPPHILHDHQRVYVTHDDGVTALSIKTGAVLWHSPGPSERMHMAGGSDIVLLMDGEVVRLAPSGERRWSFPSLVRGSGESSGGGLTVIPGGDLIEFEHDAGTDRGVGVRRFDPGHGTELWSTRSRPLGVEHLKYRHHAYVDLEIDQLEVSSYGTDGTFFEWLALATGRQVRRERE